MANLFSVNDPDGVPVSCEKALMQPAEFSTRHQVRFPRLTTED